MSEGDAIDDRTRSFVAIAKGIEIFHYRIIERIGAGGMGEVYLAEDSKLNRRVALKFLASHLSDNDDYRRRFVLEARAAARLDHPAVLAVYEVGEFEGRPFFVMQYADGKPLRELMSAGSIPFERVLEIIIQICQGIEEAHARQVIHRDVKPANIIVSSRDRVKILDFGLARVLEDSGHTQTGALIGTVDYMSPEQVHGRPVDHRTDIFSTGVVFYELLTGAHPFRRSSIPATIQAIVTEEPRGLYVRRHTIPPECQSIVDKSMAKSPERRYRSIAEFLADLERLKERYCAVESDAPSRLYPSAAPVQAELPSIAVLPFVNMSPDPDNEYFADGLSEELLNVLTKIGNLRVAARTSSFAYRNSRTDIPAIGKHLNVSTILEGSVRKFNNRVRITVQLIKVSDGYHLWSETYDRTLGDIFHVQDDIARSVVKELRVALTGEKADSLTEARAEADVALAIRGRGDNAEAHRQYLRGQYLVERLTRDDVDRAVNCFQKAIDMDPSHALAWVGLSRAYADQAGHGWLPCAEGFARSRTAAERALEIESDLAEGHLRMALIRMSFDWDWQGALDSVTRAMELAPGKVSVLKTAAHLASNLDRLEEAITLMRKVVTLDPLSSTAYHSLGLYCYAADRLDEAAKFLETALELNSRQVGLWFDYARVHLSMGHKEQALAEAQQEVFEPFRLLGSALTQHACADSRKSDLAIHELIDKYGEDGAYQIAEAFAFRGEVDQAFEWLNRAYRQRDPGLPEMRTEPLLRSLHADPKWHEMLRGIGFIE